MMNNLGDGNNGLVERLLWVDFGHSMNSGSFTPPRLAGVRIAERPYVLWPILNRTDIVCFERVRIYPDLLN